MLEVECPTLSSVAVTLTEEYVPAVNEELSTFL